MPIKDSPKEWLYNVTVHTNLSGEYQYSTAYLHLYLEYPDATYFSGNGLFYLQFSATVIPERDKFLDLVQPEAWTRPYHFLPSDHVGRERVRNTQFKAWYRPSIKFDSDHCDYLEELSAMSSLCKKIDAIIAKYNLDAKYKDDYLARHLDAIKLLKFEQLHYRPGCYSLSRSGNKTGFSSYA